MDKMNERIVCLRSDAVDSACKLGWVDDKVFVITKEVLEFLLEHSEIRRRGDVENNPYFKQVIPYGILLKRIPNCGLGPSFYCLSYRRTKKGGDGRLHDFYSIGFGGHMREGELPIDCLVRELNEELKYDGKTNYFGEFVRKDDCIINDHVIVINDNSTPVNRDHFGIVFTVHVDINKVESNEDTISELEKIDSWNLRAKCDRYESWSQLVINIR